MLLVLLFSCSLVLTGTVQVAATITSSRSTGSYGEIGDWRPEKYFPCQDSSWRAGMRGAQWRCSSRPLATTATCRTCPRRGITTPWRASPSAEGEPPRPPASLSLTVPGRPQPLSWREGTPKDCVVRGSAKCPTIFKPNKQNHLIGMKTRL